MRIGAFRPCQLNSLLKIHTVCKQYLNICNQLLMHQNKYISRNTDEKLLKLKTRQDWKKTNIAHCKNNVQILGKLKKYFMKAATVPRSHASQRASTLQTKEKITVCVNCKDLNACV